MITFKASGKISRLSDLYSRLDGVFKDHVEEIINVNGSDFHLLRMLRLTKHGIQTPGGLLEALVDTYDMDGHYFKINDHVLNITLENVLYITGLPIDGREFVENIDEVNSYSWGAAFLATLYVGIEKFKLKLKKRVDGNCWPLLEIRWHVYDEAMLDDDMRLNHLSSVYYAPVINMHAVAHHRPICHLRQFRGLEKYVDLAKYVRWTARNIILKENKGNNNKDLTIFCARWISLWDNREPISKYIKKALNIEDSDEEDGGYEDGFHFNDNFSQHSSLCPSTAAPSPQRCLKPLTHQNAVSLQIMYSTPQSNGNHPFKKKWSPVIICLRNVLKSSQDAILCCDHLFIELGFCFLWLEYVIPVKSCKCAKNTEYVCKAGGDVKK
ncbi:hypothetical protein L1887_18777 [Cichorium endivia]|nr:hypothetical protein L1887_18777 [Cichorium endivia]